MPHIGAAKFASLLGGNGVASRYLQRGAVSASKDYIAFVKLLYLDIDDISNTLQSNPQRRHRLSEDGISDEIVSNLGTAGYDASQDTSSGGHVDITVRLGKHTWIGEAKKDQKFDEGFLQLSTRYTPASGNFKHNHGGMLLYCTRGPDLLTMRAKWLKKLSGMRGFRRLETIDCPESDFAFFSRHVHPVSGKHFIVRHLLIGLHFRPQDASARRSAKSRTRRPRR